ncbi:uncharacterized protein LOC128641193 [Bombina bombina]|uniref:uncharacterized protein LOC128641193 n=1 Tax=Bombina bombina TaxID=8345 RepID=UPI00235A88DE|nr:uncharacterized protein LOC128641193 [Bombina bombina]
MLQRFRHEYGSHLQLSQRNRQHSSSQQKIGQCSQLPNRDLKDKSIKRDRKITKHGKLSIFIQEKEVNVDLSDCTDSEDSLYSDWLISAHTDLSHYRSPKAQNHSYSSLEDELVEIGDTDYDDFVMSCKNLITTSSPKQTRKTDGTQRLTAGYHSRVYKQSSDASIREFSLKSSQASKIPVRAKPKGNFSCQLLTGYKGTYRYSHTDRYNTQIPHFCHSRFSKPSVPLAQSLWFSRKPLIMGKSLDHTDHKIINSVLDQALSTARSMKRTTEHMIRRLAEDLHNA